jgi:CheY-like chemotaxis protein
MEHAERLLRADQFDLIVCTVLFDDSRMFDLLRMAKSRHEWQQIPFVCVRVRSHVLSDRIAREAAAFTCHALGAVAFLDIDDYKADPERELRQAIERHLPLHT